MNALEPNLTDSVTLHMRREFAHLRADQTVGDALAAIRQNPPQDRIIYFYVLGSDDRLQGVLPTRRLLLSPDDTPLAEIMVREIVTIPETATVLEACEFFVMHRLLAFPVVDAERRVRGIVDVELYTEGIEELEESLRRDDLFQLIGVHVVEARQLSPLASFRRRVPWLMCNVGGGLLAAFLTGLYEAELQKVVAVALFIPVVLALAEGVTIQSVSIALQVMRGSRPTGAQIARRLASELGAGFLLGLITSSLVAVVCLLWIGNAQLAACLLVGISLGVICAAGIGLALPNLLRLLDRDPHVAAGPVALAASDMVTLLLYFNSVRWLLN